MANFTEQAIKKTFLELLEERPLSSITVRELSAACGINRNTFYYHFSDIPALLECIICEDCDQIIREYPSPDSIEECLLVAAEFARKKRRLILHIYESADRRVFETNLWRLCSYATRTYLDTAVAGHNPDHADTEVILVYLKCIGFGLTMDWLENGMASDIRPVIRRLCELNQGHIDRLFDSIS